VSENGLRGVDIFFSTGTLVMSTSRASPRGQKPATKTSSASLCRVMCWVGRCAAQDSAPSTLLPAARRWQDTGVMQRGQWWQLP